MIPDKKIYKEIEDLLEIIYDKQIAKITLKKVKFLINKYRDRIPPYSIGKELDQTDVVLITYGDILKETGEKPLKVLKKFLDQYVTGIINTIHVLPFYPYSSDDGFSVIDYREVNRDLGGWEDIVDFGKKFKLMVDLVANHVSAKSLWFKKYKNGVSPFTNYFIEVENGTDLKEVFRPRTSPLLKKVRTLNGIKNVWATFSHDQIDLNYSNYQVLVEMIEILLFYFEKGARFIRLDAIAYIWKKIGTNCIHLPQVHLIIQLIRKVIDLIDPSLKLITETNVPHKDNLSYFGDGKNEAHMVYNFSLPPLILHAFHSGNAKHLSNWGKTLSIPSKQTAFFNFLASHDGIGVTPLRGILEEKQIIELAHSMEKIGGLVSYKTNLDASESPYELNINFFDALSDPNLHLNCEDAQIKKFVCAHATMFSLKGVPGIYFHSLFGSRGWQAGVKKTGQKRSINRQKLNYDEIVLELESKNSRRAKIFSQLSQLLRIRTKNAEFSPNSEQSILDLDDRLFSLIRFLSTSNKAFLCIHNLSPDNVNGFVDLTELFANREINIDKCFGQDWVEKTEKGMKFLIKPYSVIWVKVSEITK